MTQANKSYQLICGLEVHAELKTKSKMFCGCKNDPFHAPQPNIYTCPVCLGMPGGLPVANKTAIEWTIKLGLALGCKINLFSKFDRKHYFYPDLPKGYQISQYDLPFCYDGQLDTSFGPVRIRRIHLEEDTAKLIHTQLSGQDASLIDFNRSSVPLVEVVTEPDIHSAEQAKEYGKKLRQLLRYLDIADCDMEQGGMRLEANISLKNTSRSKTPNSTNLMLADSDLPPYKVELKNINSFRFMEQAINFEIQRQTLQLEQGQIPKQETRGWDLNTNTTFPQRSKEDAEDYRYFPDPDLPPFRFTAEQIESWRSELPEIPWDRAARWQQQYQLDPKQTEPLIESTQLADQLDELAQLAAKSQLPLSKIVAALINKKMGANLTTHTPEQIIEQYQAAHTHEVVDTTELDGIIKQVLSAHAPEVSRYQAGEAQLLNFLVGQTMKKVAKKIDVALLRQLLIDHMSNK